MDKQALNSIFSLVVCFHQEIIHVIVNIISNIGEVVEIHCTYDPKSKSGSNSEQSKRKVKGTIHWVDIKSSIDVTINEYDRLFISEKPEENEDLIKGVNTSSKKIIVGKSEKYISSLAKGQKVQFQRKGYYIVDNIKNGNIIFNKTVSLRDSWRK